jgi:hypothetical protein
MATRTFTELENAQRLVAELEAKVAAEQTARDSASNHVRALAIAIHRELCPRSHERLECTWFVAPGNSNADANDPEKASWTEGQHAYWLTITNAAIGQARLLGFTVTEPVPPAPPEPVEFDPTPPTEPEQP